VAETIARLKTCTTKLRNLQDKNNILIGKKQGLLKTLKDRFEAESLEDAKELLQKKEEELEVIEHNINDTVLKMEDIIEKCEGRKNNR